MIKKTSRKVEERTWSRQRGAEEFSLGLHVSITSVWIRRSRTLKPSKLLGVVVSRQGGAPHDHRSIVAFNFKVPRMFRRDVDLRLHKLSKPKR